MRRDRSRQGILNMHASINVVTMETGEDGEARSQLKLLKTTYCECEYVCST